MFTYHSTRAQSSFEEFHASFFGSSSTDFGQGVTFYSTSSGETHEVNGGTTRISRRTAYQVTETVGHTERVSDIGNTTFQTGASSAKTSIMTARTFNQTLSNTSGTDVTISDTTLSTTLSTFQTGFQTWAAQTSTSQTFTDGYVTTTNTTLNTSVMTVTGTGTDMALAVSFMTVSAMTSTVATSTETVSFTTLSTGTASEFIELGTVVVAPDVWAWKITRSTAGDPGFISDVGASFETSVFWPETSSGAVSYYTGASTAISTFTNPGNVQTITMDYPDYNPATLTVTTGDKFSRDTTTIEDFTSTLASSSFTTGFESETFTAHAASSYTTTVQMFSAVTLHFYGSDGSEYSVRNARPYTTTASSLRPQTSFSYQGSGSTSGTTISSSISYQNSSHLSQQRTTIRMINRLLVGFTDLNTYLCRIPPPGFAAPQELHSDATHGFGSNLTFGGGTIFYPNLAGIYRGVGVPYPVNGEAYDSDADMSWRYAWSHDTAGVTLSYTKMQTTLVGTDTSTLSTSSSGTFTPGVNTAQNVFAGGNILGGYGPISSASESAYFPPRAVAGTFIGTDGVTSSFKSIFTGTATSVLRGDMYVEQSLAALQVFVLTGNFPELPVRTFNRN